MKRKLYLTSALAAVAISAVATIPVKAPVALAPAAPAEMPPATNTEIITETPEGRLVDPCYSASDKTWLVSGQAVGSISNNNGYATRMVITDSEVYISGMLSELNIGTYWVKGNIQDDGTVVFSFPQLIGRQTENGSTRTYYISQLTPSLNGSSVSLTPVEGSTDLRMKLEGNTLTQIMPAAEGQLKDYYGIVGVVNANGGFLGYGEQGISYRTVAPQLLTAPEGLATTDYNFQYTDGDNASKSRSVAIGTDGTDVWIKGLNSFIPEAWVKGTRNGNKVSIPSTYTGEYQHYLTYVTGLSANETSFVDPLTLTATDNGFTADATLFISIGDEVIDLNDNRVFYNGVFTPMAGGVRTPSDPIIDDSEEGTEYDEAEDMTAICFLMDATDTEGEPLDVNKLYYNIFVDGQVYTFPADLYGQEMTNVPYQYNCDLIYNLGGYLMVFYMGSMQKLGVQALYIDGDTVTRSAMAEYTFSTGVSELETESAGIVTTEYYSLDGRRLSAAPERGMYLRSVTRADGSRSTTKHIAR